MNEIMNNHPNHLSVRNMGGDGIFLSVLSALPTAIARPFLEYRRIGAQAPVIIKALETNEQSLADIMKTIRELGIAGQLTPELTQYPFAAYNQALMQSSYLLLGR